MQELRFVLIVVGALAIAALLFHGLWSSKKEGKAKFGNKPLGKLELEQGHNNDVIEKERDFALAPEDDYEIIRKEPDLGIESAFDSRLESDPLFSDSSEVKPTQQSQDSIPSFVAEKKNGVEPIVQAPEEAFEPVEDTMPTAFDMTEKEQQASTVSNPVLADSNEEPKSEPEMQVIVLNVHCAGEEAFIGTDLFESMQQNGLIYGEMDIFHRHVDLSGNGKVLFSVANMIHPGTFEHTDPAQFMTKGISFFMTLPCYGEAEQNFNLMLRTAQQMADDLGGNVLDDQRNLMTPDRLASYRRQIVEFNAANA